jgi:LCP family protein required for cell wall assembly
MSTLNPDSRRSLDGPIRRIPIRTKKRAEHIDEVVENAAVEMAIPVAPVPPVEPDEPPIFEYRKPKKRFRPLKGRIVRKIAIVLLLLVLLVAGWFAYKVFMAGRSIIGKSTGGAPGLLGNLDPTKLKGEGDGRINVLVLGIGGPGHEAPNLSDTILVMSIDPKTKDASMLSIPRDLYVKIPAVPGKYRTQYSKINSANAYGGPELSQKVVTNVIGVPIHYYILVDFNGFKKAIDTVGGIDVDVPEAINDPSFPCDNGRDYCGFRLKAGKQHMTGTIALRYARSRHTTSDFDRAKRQQLIIAALKKKATDLSTLTNPVKLSGLIDALGGHVKTDFQPNEITKMASIIKDIDGTKVESKVLDTDGEDSLLIDGTGRIPGAGSIELPRRGNFDYTDIQDYVKNIFVDRYIVSENARIQVQNGSGRAGVASQVVKSLKSAHYNVMDPTNADEILTKTVIYDYTGGKKPYTINYLERRFGVKATRATAPSPTVDPTTGKPGTAPQIRIILGSDYEPGPTPVPNN